MSKVTGWFRFVCFVSVLAVSTGCLGTGTSDSNNGNNGGAADATDDATTDDATTDDTGGEDTQQPTDTGSDEDTSAQDTSTQDTGGTEDAGTTEDTGGTEDTTEPEDTGDVFQNPCENGPLDEPIENCSPTPLPSTGDPAEDCVRRINQFRWECQCLPPLERWTEGEACAEQQAAYDAENNTPHAGFQQGICSPRGRAQNECPGYGSWDRVIGTCLQQMWDEGPGQPFSEHGHYINMSSTEYSMVACGGADGWFVQNFR